MSLRNLMAILTMNGVPYHPIDMDVTMTSAQNSDTLSATLAMSEYPGISELLASSQEIEVTATVIAAAGSGMLFTGTVDDLDCDFTRRTMHISARDKSKGPIEKKTTEDFRNKKPEQIVQEIAGRHGLKPVIGGAGGDLAGKIFNADHVLLTDHISEWSLIQNLADREGKVAFVTKDELHYEDLDAGTMGNLPVLYMPPGPWGHANGNFIDLRCSRDFQLAKGGEVNVRSWHSKKKKSVVGTEKKSGGIGGAPNIWEHRHPQLEQGQADKIAKKRLRENIRQEMSISLTMPGMASVVPRMTVSLAGTGTIFDQLYYIDSVRHSVGRGYVMDIDAKNSQGGK